MVEHSGLKVIKMHALSRLRSNIAINNSEKWLLGNAKYDTVDNDWKHRGHCNTLAMKPVDVEWERL